MNDEQFQNMVFVKLDKIDEKIDDLCERTTSLEKDLSNHLTTEVQKTNYRFKILTVIIAVIGTGFVGLNILKAFGVI